MHEDRGSDAREPRARGNGPGGARVHADQPGSPDTAPAWHQPQSPAAWRHQVHVDQFKIEADDPQHQPAKGCLVWQLGAKGSGAWAHGDLAVVEFRAQRAGRPGRRK